MQAGLQACASVCNCTLEAENVDSKNVIWPRFVISKHVKIIEETFCIIFCMGGGGGLQVASIIQNRRLPQISNLGLLFLVFWVASCTPKKQKNHNQQEPLKSKKTVLNLQFAVAFGFFGLQPPPPPHIYTQLTYLCDLGWANWQGHQLFRPPRPLLILAPLPAQQRVRVWRTVSLVKGFKIKWTWWAGL